MSDKRQYRSEGDMFVDAEGITTGPGSPVMSKTQASSMGDRSPVVIQADMEQSGDMQKVTAPQQGLSPEDIKAEGRSNRSVAILGSLLALLGVVLAAVLVQHC